MPVLSSQSGALPRTSTSNRAAAHRLWVTRATIRVRHSPLRHSCGSRPLETRENTGCQTPDRTARALWWPFPPIKRPRRPWRPRRTCPARPGLRRRQKCPSAADGKLVVIGGRPPDQTSAPNLFLPWGLSVHVRNRFGLKACTSEVLDARGFGQYGPSSSLQRYPLWSVCVLSLVHRAKEHLLGLLDRFLARDGFMSLDTVDPTESTPLETSKPHSGDAGDDGAPHCVGGNSDMNRGCAPAGLSSRRPNQPCDGYLVLYSRVNRATARPGAPNLHSVQYRSLRMTARA